ncbi:Relaxase/Mobilisation nuclease domain-containing protein, partial [Loktanella sp. DSM 29012]|uniref:relaxase/mobilization nuclease domain-containing protein n=1 Tax=Loktanella sp. DSM 29012 TaxID=1881056 RepID=UPI0008D26FC1
MIPKAISRHKDAKRTTAGDVARVVRYVCGKAVAVELCNLSGDWQDAPMQMWAVADGSSRATSLMYHMMLSWPETECPTDAQAIEAARTAIAELGVQDHQAVIAVHRDRTCVHVHVVINRINALTFGAMSTSNDFTKLERACRQIEATQGWSADRGRFDAVVTETPDGPKVTLEPKPQAHWEAKQERRAAERGPSASDIHAERKTGVVSLAEALSDPWKERIRAAMDEAPDWAGVHEALSEIGLRYVKSGSGARILLVGSDAYMKPSQLGKPYAMGPMQKRFGPLVTPESLEYDAATHKAMMSGGNDVEELQQHSQQLERVVQNALILDDADAAPLTRSETFKLTLLQRSYVGVTLDPDVVRAINRVTLDASPPTVTLRDGGSVVDKGTSILGSSDGDDATKAKLMIALAAAKGWDRCKITGSEAFCQIAVQLA